MCGGTFDQHEHRSSFSPLRSRLPLIFPLVSSTLAKPAEANPSSRAAPRRTAPIRTRRPTSLPNFGGFSNHRRHRRRCRRGGRGRRYNRSAGSPLADRSARDLISRTRAETQCVKLRLVGAGAHEKRSAQRRSERVYASLLACLPDCLTPASCLPVSFGGEQPAASRCLSREWPVYMLTLCLRVFRPLPSRASPRDSHPSRGLAPRSSLSSPYHSPSSSVSLTVSSLSLSPCLSLSLSLSLNLSFFFFLSFCRDVSIRDAE